MTNVISIDLKNAIPEQGAIQFVRAEAPRQPRPWLVLVRYSRWGVEQATGARLDLDKRVFIDHFEGDPQTEAAFKRAAPQIASHVSVALRARAS
jgi:hypothetical protein